MALFRPALTVLIIDFVLVLTMFAPVQVIDSLKPMCQSYTATTNLSPYCSSIPTFLTLFIVFMFLFFNGIYLVLSQLKREQSTYREGGPE